MRKYQGVWQQHGEEIVRLRNNGYSLKLIGKEFGVSKQAIQQSLVRHIGTVKMPMLCHEQLAVMLGCSANTLKKVKHLLHPITHGTVVYYPNSDIEVAREAVTKRCKGCSIVIPRIHDWCPFCLASHLREKGNYYAHLNYWKKKAAQEKEEE